MHACIQQDVLLGVVFRSLLQGVRPIYSSS